jgi:hypothetical protein
VGDSDVYKVGGKVFAIVGDDGMSFKVSEIGFMALTENGPGRQAPYAPRAMGERQLSGHVEGRCGRLAEDRPHADRRQTDEEGASRVRPAVITRQQVMDLALAHPAATQHPALGPLRRLQGGRQGLRHLRVGRRGLSVKGLGDRLGGPDRRRTGTPGALFRAGHWAFVALDDLTIEEARNWIERLVRPGGAEADQGRAQGLGLA